jgi:hypothetical protein
MDITITRNFPNLEDLELVTADDMRQLGLIVRENIIARTVQGQDADGNPFAPYSPEYAKRKRAALGTSAVNLQASGNMLNHIQIIETETSPEQVRVRLGWNQ